MVKSPVAGSEKLRDEEDAPSTYAWSASTSHTRKQSTREMRPCRVKTVGGRRWGFHGYKGRVTKKSQRCEEVDSRSIMSNTFACGLYSTVKCLRMWLVLHGQMHSHVACTPQSNAFACGLYSTVKYLFDCSQMSMWLCFRQDSRCARTLTLPSRWTGPRRMCAKERRMCVLITHGSRILREEDVC